MLKPRPQTPEEEKDIRRDCHKLKSAGLRFLKELEADDHFRLTQPFTKVMVYATRHQVEAVDAALILSKGGRPQFANAICRAIYETYLNILAIGWLNCKVGHIQYFRSYNARRFDAYWTIAVTRLEKEIGGFEDSWKDLGIPEAEGKKKRQLMLRRARAAKHKYEFKDTTTCWFHHQGVKGMFDKLWPEGGNPCFPWQLFDVPEGRKQWVEMFGLFWGGDSNQVHANMVGLTSGHEDARGKWPQSKVEVNFVNAMRACQAAWLSLFAAADALGKLGAFNLIVTACEREPYTDDE